MNRVRVIHELLRDLEGTVKANGDTEEIKEIIMEHVRKMQSEIISYATAFESATEMISTINKRVEAISEKMEV